MASFVELTNVNEPNRKFWVNMDLIIHVERSTNHTILSSIAETKTGPRTIDVREQPKEIMDKLAQRK